MHSKSAIVKPLTKSQEASQREIEEAMKKVKEAQSLIAAAAGGKTPREPTTCYIFTFLIVVGNFILGESAGTRCCWSIGHRAIELLRWHISTLASVFPDSNF